MGNVKYWIVKCRSKSENGAMKNVAYFTSEHEADTFATGDFMLNNYSDYGVVEKVEFQIHDTSDSASENLTNQFRQSGLSKLSPNERRALGLLGSPVETKSVLPGVDDDGKEEVKPEA